MAFGDIVESTGEVQDMNGIQRLRISQGWISMNLRESNGTIGAPVVERIDYPVHDVRPLLLFYITVQSIYSLLAYILRPVFLENKCY